MTSRDVFGARHRRGRGEARWMDALLAERDERQERWRI